MSRNAKSMTAAAEAFNRRDLEALEALLTKDAEIVPIRAALEGTVYRGPDAAAQWYEAVDDSWDELRVEIEDVRGGGDCIVALGRVRGRGRASGAEIDVAGASVGYFRDGLITRLHQYTDRAEALEAAGLEE